MRPPVPYRNARLRGDEDARGKAEVVLMGRRCTANAQLAPCRVSSKPTKIGRQAEAMLRVQVIELAEARAEVPGEFHIQAAAESHGKSVFREGRGREHGGGIEADVVAAE